MTGTNPEPLQIHVLSTETELDVLLACAGRILMTGTLSYTPQEVATDPARIAGELRRMLYGRFEVASAERELWIWEDHPQDGQGWKILGDMLAAKMRMNGPGSGSPSGSAHSTAVALAWSILAVDEAAAHGRINFLQAKLAEPPAQRLTRTQRWAAAAAMPILLFCLWMTWDWYSQQQAIAQTQAQLRELMPQIKEARLHVDKVTQARLWYDRRPAMLDCLRDISLAMPASADGSVWITSLVLRDDLSGTLSGKAQDEKNAMELVNRLRHNGPFTEVRLLYLRQTDRTSKVVSFALTLQHQAGRKS